MIELVKIVPIGLSSWKMEINSKLKVDNMKQRLQITALKRIAGLMF